MSVLNKAFELFRGLRKKDVVVYTAMIMGCGINGRDSDAIELFEEMIHSKLSPNLVTFTGLLTAFGHVGLVEEGYHCFNSMKNYGLVPSADHYSLMVDLLGRAGKLVEARDLIKSMPMQPHAGVLDHYFLLVIYITMLNLGKLLLSIALSWSLILLVIVHFWPIFTSRLGGGMMPRDCKPLSMTRLWKRAWPRYLVVVGWYIVEFPCGRDFLRSKPPIHIRLLWYFSMVITFLN